VATPGTAFPSMSSGRTDLNSLTGLMRTNHYGLPMWMSCSATDENRKSLAVPAHADLLIPRWGEGLRIDQSRIHSRLVERTH
jgi:hypothetical protein